jgi:hypothetical protein
MAQPSRLPWSAIPSSTNAAYTAGAPDVISHLRAELPSGWRASLLAVDGSTTGDLAPQLDARRG